MSSVLDLSRRLLALSQTGLHFTAEEYDRERYREIGDIAARLLELQQPQVSADAVKQAWFVEGGYATPKVEVRGAIFRDGQVLLVRERADGKWTLPGGWADVNDSPSSAVLKEIEQESGFTARVTKLVGIYDRNKHNLPKYLYQSWKLFFVCEITGGEARTSYETSAVEFFPLDALPELSTGRSNAEQIRRTYQHFQHPDWPTEFD
jgi:ADP-ribose pyrophosphatase YjhB (NUDIX family)